MEGSGAKNPGTRLQYLKTISDEEIKSCLKLWQKDLSDMANMPDMVVLAFVAESDASKVPDLQDTFKSASVPLIGAIFPALVYGSEFKCQGVLLICLPGRPLWHLEADLPQDKEKLSTCLDSISKHLEKGIKDSEDTALFMIFDAMVPNISTILDDLYVSLGDSVHYMGVNAGSETFTPIPCLFDDKNIIQNGLLTILLTPHRGAILEHGYLAPEKTIVATSTKANCITHIDWKPAFDIYKERVKNQFNIEITAENFYQYGAHFPFGIIRADGEVLVRIPVMIGEDKSLYCVGEIPENSILTLLDAPEPASLHTVEDLTSKLGNSQENILFYCAGRRMHLEDAASNELKDLKNINGNNTFAGALSLGEIGSSQIGGYPLFHNATLVVMPLGSKND